MAKRNSALIWGRGLVVIHFIFVMVFGMRREGFLVSGDECTADTCKDCPDGYGLKTLNSGMEKDKCRNMCSNKYNNSLSSEHINCESSCTTNRAGNSLLVCD